MIATENFNRTNVSLFLSMNVIKRPISSLNLNAAKIGFISKKQIERQQEPVLIKIDWFLEMPRIHVSIKPTCKTIIHTLQLHI